MFIELDRGESAERAASPTKRQLGRRLRPWLAALIVLALLALGSAGGRPRPALQHVADIVVQADAEMISVDQNLLIIEPGALTAYDPQTARQHWRVQTGLQRQWVEVEGDTLLVAGSGALSAADPTEAASMAITAATGQVRWRIPGNLQRLGGYMIAHEIRYAPFPVGRLTVYNLAAQRLWSADEVSPLHALDSERQVVFTVHPTSGEVAEFRLDNGAVISRTVVPEFVGAVGLYAGGGEIGVYLSTGGSMTLRNSAMVTRDPVESNAFFSGEPVDCGTVWCVRSAPGTGIVLVDKTTGENVHQGEPWRSAIRTDFGVVGAAPDFQRGTVTINVFDSATRRQRKIEGWSLIGTNFQSRIEAFHGQLYLTAAAPARTFFAVLDHAGLHVAGSVPHENLLQCTATGSLVACRVDPQTIKIWHPAH
jgi:hypothetical protein